MSLSQLTPWEQKVITAFAQHLAEHYRIVQTSQQAAQHGENPMFAKCVRPLLDASQEVTPTEIAAMWAAVPSAVIATVRDFSEETRNAGHLSQT